MVQYHCTDLQQECTEVHTQDAVVLLHGTAMALLYLQSEIGAAQQPAYV